MTSDLEKNFRQSYDEFETDDAWNILRLSKNTSERSAHLRPTLGERVFQMFVWVVWAYVAIMAFAGIVLIGVGAYFGLKKIGAL